MFRRSFTLLFKPRARAEWAELAVLTTLCTAAAGWGFGLTAQWVGRVVLINLIVIVVRYFVSVRKPAQ